MGSLFSSKKKEDDEDDTDEQDLEEVFCDDFYIYIDYIH
jgi:hypothetical protein